MKRYLILLLGMLITASFVFAGGQKESSASAPSASQAKSAAEKTPIEIYDPSFVYPTNKIQLTYWEACDGRPGYPQLVRKFISEYEAIHPNVDISVRQIPNAGERAIWAAAFESHTAPDVMWIEAQVGIGAKELRVAPQWVASMINKTFTPYAASLGRINGKYYGWDGSEIDAGQMLYYNEDMFSAAGLNPSTPPTTMPQFQADARKLTQYNANGSIKVAGVSLRYAGGPQGVGDKFGKYCMPFMNTTKYFYYNKNFTDVAFDYPGWVQGATFVKDLVFKWKVTNTSLPIPLTAMAQGLAAMTMRESFAANYLKQHAPSIHFGIGPFPNGAPPYGKYETGAIPWLAMVGVSADSKHPQIAWDFAMFMASQKNELQMVKNNGGMSRLKANQDDPYFKTLPYYHVYNIMTKQRPLVQNPYLDPNGIQAYLEASLGEKAVQILTNPNADPAKLLKQLAVAGRKRLKEVQSQQ